MIPSEYKLQEVVARLIERLEGVRPSHQGEGAKLAFSRAAADHLDAVSREIVSSGMLEAPQRQVNLLRTEVLETFLPRYTRLAEAQNLAEARHFGFGPLGLPLGRLGLVVVSLLVLWFVLVRLISVPVVWPLIVLDLSLPLWPDIVSRWSVRRYHAELERIVVDMERIQVQAAHYLSDPLSSTEVGSTQRVRQPKREDPLG